MTEAAAPTSSPPAPSFAWFFALVLWAVLMGLSLVSVIWFVAFDGPPLALILANAGVLILFWVVAVFAGRRRRVDRPRCQNCEGALYATRSGIGSRFWTCFSCGTESHRRPSRPSIAVPAAEA